MERTIMSRANFFRLCEQLKKRQGDLSATRPTNSVACDILSRDLGFKVPMYSLVEAKKATGVSWRPPGNPGGKFSGTSRVIVGALVNLYAQLGVEAPEDLERLFDRVNNAGQDNGRH